MVRKLILSSLGSFIVLLTACGEDTKGGAATASGGSHANPDAGSIGGSGGKMGSGGTAGLAGHGTAGGSDGGRATTGGNSGNSAGHMGSSGGHPNTADAAADAAEVDAAPDAPSAPQGLGVREACGTGTATCCEAYACRDGKCCVPTGVWSNCLSGADCCSGSCVLNQCTCVPLGYTCTGAGQCCSGYSCVNGTCICPPDIRGC
jgi:hypothetical protein